MLSACSYLKVLRLPGYFVGRYVILCSLFLGETLLESALGASHLSNLEPYTLSSIVEDISTSSTLSDRKEDVVLVPSPWFPADFYSLSTQASTQSSSSEFIEEYDKSDVLYLAAPENFNPGLYVPPPNEPLPDSLPPPESLESEPIPPEPDKAESEETPFVPLWDIDGLTVNLSDDFSNFDQSNRIIEPIITGTLSNGDRLTVSTGFNRYTQSDVDTVFNIPFKTAWSREMGDFTTTVGGGVDFFNQLPVAINLNTSTSIPIGTRATLSFFIDYGPYKFNATTLNNQVTALRYGPNLYWQITPNMYLFSLARWGRYNDGNQEQQSFSRLEKKLGEFYIAGNVFTWRYREDSESASGYFSPPDFLVANGEIGWKGEVLEWLDCGAAASWGQQRLNSNWSSAYSYNATCTFQVTDFLEMDLGYAFSNVIAQTGSSAFNNRAITGQVRAKF